VSDPRGQPPAKRPTLKRNYEAAPIFPEDVAFVRSLVIHDDAAILAFNKPAGLPVQTRHAEDRTLDRLLAVFARSNGKRPRLVHRLDAQTSGVIIAGKTQPAAAALSAAFAGRDMHKRYLALVSGQPFDGEEGAIDIPLSRYPSKPGLELMRAARPGDEKPQPALTRWQVLASAGASHLVALAPETGRMHQLRVHLSLVGRPIVGDPYYGGATTLAGQPTRLMLHASRLEGPHPSGGRFNLGAPLPADFTAILQLAGFDLARLDLASVGGRV
jgi:tRNA pseudouridine32 synthase/23S rRNA pseudouridine746 synthase